MKKISVILLLLGLVVIAGCHNDKEEESVVCTCELRQINICAGLYFCLRRVVYFHYQLVAESPWLESQA